MSIWCICCCCYHKGTYFQANHNLNADAQLSPEVVVATTKVRIFKQITTRLSLSTFLFLLLLLPQRYVFSSKSQLNGDMARLSTVVVATTKVRIFKQITTRALTHDTPALLLLLPQRYVFSSKSQPQPHDNNFTIRCCCYHKGTYFQANHNHS